MSTRCTECGSKNIEFIEEWVNDGKLIELWSCNNCGETFTKEAEEE
jgi:ribosomal protein L37AE/L43A